MTEQRKHSRTAFSAQVRIMHPIYGDAVLKMRDLSHGGAFLYTDDTDSLAPGTVVKLQIQGMAEEPPLIDAKVVRVDDDGVALAFVADES